MDIRLWLLLQLGTELNRFSRITPNISLHSSAPHSAFGEHFFSVSMCAVFDKCQGQAKVYDYDPHVPIFHSHGWNWTDYIWNWQEGLLDWSSEWTHIEASQYWLQFNINFRWELSSLLFFLELSIVKVPNTTFCMYTYGTSEENFQINLKQLSAQEWIKSSIMDLNISRILYHVNDIINNFHKD